MASREEAMERVLDAALELFAGQNPHTVTVREIAARAGISHTLIHRYFGTKRELLQAVIEHRIGLVAAQIPPDATTQDAVRQAFDMFTSNPEVARTLVRVSLEQSAEAATLQRGFPVVSRMIELMRTQPAANLDSPPEQFDPRYIAMIVAATAFGFVSMEPWLLRAVGFEDHDPAEVRTEVSRLLSLIARVAKTD